MRRLGLLLLIGLLLTAPAASAQSPVERCSKQCQPQDPDVNGPDIKRGAEPVLLMLYAHFEDILQNAPLNAQLPDPTREMDLNRGFPMPVIDLNTNTPADLHFKNNEFKLFSSPGLVEYGEDHWRIHQEPGLAHDLMISGSELTLYWYMSAHAVPTQSSSGSTNFAAMPQVAVYARLETGRHPFHGVVIAESDDFDKTMPPSDKRVNMITMPGQPDVYEFVVKLKVVQPVIPEKAEFDGFTLYVNPYQIKDDKQKGTQLAQSDWRLRTGPKFLPRLVIPAVNVMETRASSMNLFDDRLFLRWSFTSALGSYDMRDANLDLQSTGPNKIDPKAIDHIILKKSIDHDGHFKPVNSTWAIDYLTFPMADGEYELTASIPNMQRTYLLEHKFQFTVVKGVPQVPSVGSNAAPGGGVVHADGVKPDGSSPSLSAALAALAVLAVVAWRRRP